MSTATSVRGGIVNETTARMLADFGATLRRLRQQRRMSLSDLAEVVHYSRSHLSRIENGRKRPSLDLARWCDGALDTGGVLRRHPAVARPAADTDGAPARDVFDEDPWVLRVAPDGSGSWEAYGFTHLLRGGAAPLPAQWTMFGALRSMGRTTRPAAVLPVAVALFSVVRSAVFSSVGRARRDQMIVGARLAEYLGWMWQEAGDDNAALVWTDRAVAIAREADDLELSEYAAARRALVALYRYDADQVVALTERPAATASPRVRWLSALREAQGHALAGDRSRCLAALDRARALTPAAVDSSEPSVLGPATAGDRLAAVSGWCLYDLGHPGEAVPQLRRAVETMTPHTREHTRWGVRLALAHAASGDLARGCALMTDLLDAILQVDSATIRSDLRSFGQILERNHREPVAAALRPRLALALAPAR
jgi:DNA-binding XRE family transcriptional regulator